MELLEPSRSAFNLETDPSINALSLSNNKRVFFLPIRVQEVFPNLVAYTASNCSLVKISKDNFQNLGSLRYLYMSYNNIDGIPGNTFEDLISLEFIFLGKNIFV